MTDFLNLRDHVIVITGGASGMGRAIAQAASREGARLVLSDFDGDRLKATAGELGGQVRYLRADVSRLPEIDPIFELAEREFGRVDGLVTCAGIITTLPMLEVTSEEWDRVFAVNAKGTFFTVQAALRRMLPHKHGRIVTIGSDSYKLGGGRIANIPYAATKGAVVTMTKGFARTLVGTGVRINCINPDSRRTASRRKHEAVQFDYLTQGEIAQKARRRYNSSNFRTTWSAAFRKSSSGAVRTSATTARARSSGDSPSLSASWRSRSAWAADSSMLSFMDGLYRGGASSNKPLGRTGTNASRPSKGASAAQRRAVRRPVTYRHIEGSMQTHRWWLAIVATLLTPWIGPHIDQYVPVGWVLFQAGAEDADRGFWVIAAAALGAIYLAWFVLFSGLAAWLARRRRDDGRSSGHA